MSHPVLHFRKASVDDAAELALVGGATFLETFAGVLSGEAVIAHCFRNHTPAAYEALLAKPTTHAWLAETPGGVEQSPAPVGYLMLSAPDFPSIEPQPGDMELKRIYLFSRFHGGGTAQRMMDLAIVTAREQGAPRLLLGVHPENLRAIRFYERNGFQQVGTRDFRLGNAVYHDLVLGRTV